jgi:hypothetical protein
MSEAWRFGYRGVSDLIRTKARAPLLGQRFERRFSSLRMGGALMKDFDVGGPEGEAFGIERVPDWEVVGATRRT